MQEGQGEEPVFRLWELHLVLVLLLVFLFCGSAIVCGVDDACRNHIPTVANMLQSPLAAPFIITGFNAALLVHALVVVGIVVVASRRATYWCALQAVLAFSVYGALILTLFVLPFTGWANNWTNVVVLVAIGLWMVVAQVALMRGLRQVNMVPLVVSALVYWLCLIPYIVVRAISWMPLLNRDVGMLVCQVVGAVTLGVYVALCLMRVAHVGIRFYHPENKIA